MPCFSLLPGNRDVTGFPAVFGDGTACESGRAGTGGTVAEGAASWLSELMAVPDDLETDVFLSPGCFEGAANFVERTDATEAARSGTIGELDVLTGVRLEPRAVLVVDNTLLLDAVLTLDPMSSMDSGCLPLLISEEDAVFERTEAIDPGVEATRVRADLGILTEAGLGAVGPRAPC